MNSIKFNIILNTLYQILTLLTPLITAPYISRVIGAEGIGVYSFTNSIQMYFAMFAALGTSSYGAREISMNRNDALKRSKLFWEIELLTVMTTIICVIGWGIWINFNTQYVLLYSILTIALLSVMADVSWFYVGLEQFKYIVFQNAIFKIVGIVAIFTFVKTQKDLCHYVFIMAVTIFLSNLSMWIYLPKFLIKVNFRELNILRHFRETIIYFIPTIATSIYTVLDKTLIGIYASNGLENGYYEQTTKIINMCKTLVFTSVNTVLGSRIAYLFAENKTAEIKKRIEDSMDFILFMGIGMAFGLFGVAETFVPWFFGSGYEKVILLLQLMCPIVAVIGISNCLGSQYYTPAGLRAVSAMFLIVGAGVNLLLNLYFIPRWGSAGAVVASVIAESVITFFSIDYFCWENLITLSWKRIVSGGLMLLALEKVILFSFNPICQLILKIIIGSMIYLIVLVVLKDSMLLNLWNILKYKKVRSG